MAGKTQSGEAERGKSQRETVGSDCHYFYWYFIYDYGSDHIGVINGILPYMAKFWLDN